jgi:hypothetical protein
MTSSLGSGTMELSIAIRRTTRGYPPVSREDMYQLRIDWTKPCIA